MADGSVQLDMLDWMSRVALELIGQGGLGYSFSALDESVKNEYGEAIRQFGYVIHLSLRIQKK